MWGESERTRAESWRCGRPTRSWCPARLEEGECAGRLERTVAMGDGCHSEQLRHRVGLRKETLEVEENTGGKENTKLVFCSD